jgi:nucleoside-specific outer membrane channel protein Tsx
MFINGLNFRPIFMICAKDFQKTNRERQVDIAQIVPHVAGLPRSTVTALPAIALKGQMMRHRIRIAAVVTAALATAGGASAENFSTTEIQLLYGEGFHLGRNGFGETGRLTATIEHFSTWAYGDNFFFVDLNRDFDGTGPASDEYGEYWGHLSAAKTLGYDFGGIVRDVNLGFGVNGGTDFLVGAVGPRVDLNVPGFNVFTVGLYAYNNIDDPFGRDLDTAYQATWVWNAPIVNRGRWNVWTQGFVDYIDDQGAGVDHQIVFQPQLRLDLGQLTGNQAGKVEAGLEYAFFKNKFGVTGVDDHVIQAMLVFNLH